MWVCVCVSVCLCVCVCVCVLCVLCVCVCVYVVVDTLDQVIAAAQRYIELNAFTPSQTHIEALADA